jgi:hypothetical protein
MSKYTPLRTFLARAGKSELELSFEDIERTLGFPLPRSARVHRPWWSNEASGSHVQARAWMDAGYQVWEVDLNRGRTRFRRKEPDPRNQAGPDTPDGPDTGTGNLIHLRRDALSPAAQRLLADYSAEADHDEGAALARAVHEAAKARRAALVAAASAGAPKVADDSVALIREDRDGR